MSRRLFAFVLPLISLLGAVQPSPVRIPFQEIDGLVSVPASIAGQNARVLVDLGAGFDVLSQQFARRIGLNATQRYTGWRMQGDRIDVAMGTVPEITIGSFTINHPLVGMWNGLDGSGFDGLISAIDFRDTPITFDYASRELTFETPESLALRASGAVKIPLALQDDRGMALDVFARFDFGRGVQGLCIIDTGSQGVFLDTHFARLLGINLDDPRFKRTGTGQRTRIRAPIPELHLAAEATGAQGSSRTVIFANLIYDCNVGSEIWEHRWFTLDIPDRTLFVEKKVSER